MKYIKSHTAIRLRKDKYGGVILDATTVHHPLEELEERLTKVISDQSDRNLMWITLPVGKSDLIPVFTKHDFKFYDCSEESITLFKKLTHNPATPTATNHTIGVGAFVRDVNTILVVKDSIYKRYKLPGGYINNKENISQALKREVFEETGIEVKMESIVSIGHFFPGQFNESNIYIVCKARPLSKTIHIIDSREIIEAKWITIDNYLESKEVHPYNKKIVTTAMKNRGIKHEVNDYFSSQNSQHEFFF